VLTQLGSALDERLAELDRQRDLWNRTAEELRDQLTPEALDERVRTTLSAIASTRVNVERERSLVLEAQDRVVREISVTDAALEKIEAYRVEVIGHLFRADRRPVWRAMASGDAAGAALADLENDLESSLQRSREFVRSHRASYVVQLVVFVVLALLFRSARKRVRTSVEDEPELTRAAGVFRVPYSAAFLLMLLLTTWLQPRATYVLRQVVALLAVFPVLRIVRPIVDPALFRGLQAFGVFFAIDRVRGVISTSPLVEQVLFLLEMLAGMALMLWLMHPRRLAAVEELSEEQLASLRPLSMGTRVLLAGFGVAFVSGAAGYMQLARLVGGGLLLTTYAVLLLYAGLRAADGLVAFALRVPPLSHLQFVRTHRTALRRHLHGVLRFAAVVLWVTLAAYAFNISDPLVEGSKRVLATDIGFGELTLTIGNLLAFVLTIVGAFVTSRALRFVLEEDVFPRLSLARGIPYAISSILHYAILFGGFILAVSALGMDLTRFTVLAGAFGVGIGFGLQNVVNNFVSGLIMLFERPMNVGDSVQIEDVSGTVERIGIRSSTLRTGEGAQVIVPNASLISGRLTNWTLSNTRRRLDLRVGVAYGTEPEKMLELLLSVARGHQEVLAYPPAAAFFLGFGERALEFELRIWTDQIDEAGRIRSDVALAIHRALADQGVEVPQPQRLVGVEMPASEKPKP
jgi:small-conductance mechanosensitive channel